MNVQMIQKSIFLSLLITVLAKNRTSSTITIVGSSQEATLDIPIWFTANYTNYEQGDKIIYNWKDDLWTYQPIINSSGLSNWNITYDSKTYSEYTGPRRVTVIAHGNNTDQLVTANFDFILRDTLVGKISINQKNVTIPTPNFISTGNQTNLTALIHDPKDWLKFRTKKVRFYWYISSAPGVLPSFKVHADCLSPSLLINLTEPGTYTVDVIVAMNLYNISTNAPSQSIYKTNIGNNISSAATPEIITSTAATSLSTEDVHSSLQSTQPTHSTRPTQDVHSSLHSTNYTHPTEYIHSSLHSTNSTNPTHSTLPPHPPPEAHNWTCDGWWPLSTHTDEYFYKVGYFHNNTAARDPIDSLTIKGDTWINNGEMLKLNISCSGSGPWYSCNNTLNKSYNITGTETCKSENLSAETNFDECRFNLSHYFKHDGSYAYLLIISNYVSIMRKNITVNIYRGEPRPYLYSIILPVFCSLVVIIILILGWVHFKRNKQRYSIEVADFDILCPDEVERKGIVDQLKEAMNSALSEHKEEEEDNESRRRKRSNIVVEKLSVLDICSDPDFVI